MSKSIIEAIGRERALKLMSNATSKAAIESADAGLPEAVKVKGVWCRKFADGRVEPMNKEEPFVVVNNLKRRLHQI